MRNDIITVKRDFKGIFIPKIIWLDEQLFPLEKCFLAEIMEREGMDLEDKQHREYLCKFLKIQEDALTNLIDDLTKRGYLKLYD